MNKKAIIAIAAVVVIIIGSGSAFVLTKNNTEKTTAPTETVSAVTETVSASDSTEDSTEPSESTTESTSAAETSKADEYAFVQKGVWFYYDEDKREAYAFDFTDEDDVTVTYFNTENIDGEDAKFTSGKGDWKIVDGKIFIDDIPSNIDREAFVFSVKDSSIIADNGVKLEAKDKASLNYAYKHFN